MDGETYASESTTRVMDGSNDQSLPTTTTTTTTTEQPSTAESYLEYSDRESEAEMEDDEDDDVDDDEDASLGNDDDEDDDEDDDDPDNLMENQPNQNLPAVLRRSDRKRTSTVIHVKGGHTIKKDNNYVVKGTTYSYGIVDDADQIQPKAVNKKQKTNNNNTKSETSNQQHPVVLKARSSQETRRLECKRNVEAAIHMKQPLRQAFLKQHLPALEPFIEPKVKQQIDTHAIGKKMKELQVFMQPDAIQTELRDYQLQGLQWMAQMHAHNVGMILGDEMGLGKTIQTISLVCYLKEQYGTNGPSLIICPMSVLYSWCNEIKKWAPSLKYLRFHSSATDDVSIQEEDLSQYDMIVTTYEMVKSQNLKRIWQRQTFHLLVLDEGHKIKGAETQIAQAVRKIHCENRIILTGTPLANNLVEMHSLLNFLVPDVFTTSAPFADAFDLTANKVDTTKLNQAHAVLSVFMLRRLKEKVEKLMPKMLETKIVCPLSTMQIWWYKAILLKDIGLLANGGGSSAAKLANLIMQLRKCCLHPFLFDGAEDIEATNLEALVGASGKLAVLDKLLCSLYEKKHRVCLFSQFTQVLDILEDYCSMRGWKYCRFDGSTARAKRNYVVNSFNAPDSEKFIFLMSTRSGGMGLNLQTADTCILYDSDWNPALDNQAMARVHRVGQTKTVHVYRLVTAGTVEQRMIERAEKKSYLDRVVVRDGSDPAVAATGDSSEEGDEEQDAGNLLSTLQFGCAAVFGEGATKSNQLPSDEDIEVITDRLRTDDFSQGNLKGGTATVADKYDATKSFTATTDFAGIDFAEIRKEYEKHKRPKVMSDIGVIWQKKREIKNRIQMVEAKGSGYGSAVPVLKSNDYDLETGERSVFDQELRGKKDIRLKKKEKAVFEHQDFCQVCGEGGEIALCPRCPVAVHLGPCSGIDHAKDFACCSHHRCAICGKAPSGVGGFIFPCSTCPSAYCEDHLPQESQFLEPCERMESLGFSIHLGVYIHCSKQCEHVAIQEHGYRPAGVKIRDACPPKLNLSTHFGGEVDTSFEAPEDVILHHKRQRKPVQYNTNGTESQSKNQRPMFDCPDDDNDEDFVLIDEGNGPGKKKPNQTSKWQPAVAPAAPVHVLVDGEMIDAPAKAKKATAPSKTASLPLNQGEYEVTIPQPETGLGLFLGNKDGNVCFLGYRQLPGGDKSFAERFSLIRNVGDVLVAVGGISTRGLTVSDVSRLLSGSFKTKMSVRLRFFDITTTRYGFNPFIGASGVIPPSSRNQLAPAQPVAAPRPPVYATNIPPSIASTYIEYSAVLPVVENSLLIKVASSPEGTVFVGYHRLSNGSMGPAESNRLLRNIGDIIVSVDGSCMKHMSHGTVLYMLREHARTQSHVTLGLSANPCYAASHTQRQAFP